VYYSFTFVLLCQLCIFSQLCITRSAVHYSVSCVLLGQLCITRSVVYYSVSCVLLGQLCIMPSVVFYSVSFVLLGQLCNTLSVVYYSVSWALLRQLCITQSVVHFSVSCALLGQLCITRSDAYYAWFNSTCNHPPPGIPPGICHFFLTWRSIPNPRARKKRQFPTPGTAHRPQIRCFMYKT